NPSDEEGTELRTGCPKSWVRYYPSAIIVSLRCPILRGSARAFVSLGARFRFPGRWQRQAPGNQSPSFRAGKRGKRRPPGVMPSDSKVNPPMDREMLLWARVFCAALQRPACDARQGLLRADPKGAPSFGGPMKPRHAIRKRQGISH